MPIILMIIIEKSDESCFDFHPASGFLINLYDLPLISL